MTKPQIESSLPVELPFDLVSEILSHLPVKPLLRFRSVCKSWQVLIDSDFFVNLHLQNSKAKAPIFVMNRSPTEVELRPAWHPCSSYSVCRENGKDDIALFPEQNRAISEMFSDLPERKSNMLSFRSACNGLLLFTGDVNSLGGIYIVNPATKQRFMLPSFSDKILTIRWVRIFFDALSNAYKVLMAQTEPTDLDSTVDLPPHVQLMIFTIGTDKSWRKLTCPVTNPFWYDPTAVYEVVNGAVHFDHDNYFDVRDNKPEEYMECILAFNIKEETFRIIEHPNCCSPDMKTRRNCNEIVKYDHGQHSIHVAGIDGFLYLFHADIHRTIVDVWMLEDYTNGLWIKRSSFNISFLHKKIDFAFEELMDSFYMNPIAVIHGQLMLMFTSYFNARSYTIQWYDPKLGKLLDIDTTSETHAYEKYFEVITGTYVESLVRTS